MTTKHVYPTKETERAGDKEVKGKVDELVGWQTAGNVEGKA